jgi:hypothetical protein
MQVRAGGSKQALEDERGLLQGKIRRLEDEFSSKMAALDRENAKGVAVMEAKQAQLLESAENLMQVAHR